MGLFVFLYAQIDKIPAKEWQIAFDESLELLKAYPLPLVGLKWDSTTYGRRAMYAPVDLRDDDKHGQHWRVEGDARSGNHGETFRLKRKVIAEGTGANDTHDVLWQDKEDIDDYRGHGQRILHGKTQGYPFHYAMLAAAMLFESRFPERALVLGDITPEQAESVLDWSQGILKSPLELPIVMNEKRLWSRLTHIYKDDVPSAAKRFSALYRGKLSVIEALYELGMDIPDLENHIESGLNHYKTLSQRGPMRRVINMITALGLRSSIEMLHRIDQRRGKDIKFDFIELAEILVAKYINATPEEKSSIVSIHPSHNSLMNIGETFSRLIGNLSGFSPPEVISASASTNELIRLFNSVIPQHQQDTLASKIKEKTEKNHEFLTALGKQTENDADEVKTSPSHGDLSITHHRDINANENLTFSEWLQQEAKRQLIVELKPEDWGEIIINVSDIIREAAKSYDSVKALIKEQDRESVLHSLYQAIRNAGFAPLENSWMLIDSKETDLDTLKTLCVLAMFKWDELHASNLRKFIFDHPPIWPFLHHEQEDIGRKIQSVIHGLFQENPTIPNGQIHN
jgi:hypothetical protein